jgi:hypothetical protein
MAARLVLVQKIGVRVSAGQLKKRIKLEYKTHRPKRRDSGELLLFTVAMRFLLVGGRVVKGGRL